MIASGALADLFAGLVFGLSLIVAIGAQNTYVIRQGLLRQHVLIVVVICTLSDVALIAAGVAGASVALDGRHWLLNAVRVVGAAFLLMYATMAARRARHPKAPQRDQPKVPASRARVIMTCLAFTWLNRCMNHLLLFHAAVDCSMAVAV